MSQYWYFIGRDVGGTSLSAGKGVKGAKILWDISGLRWTVEVRHTPGEHVWEVVFGTSAMLNVKRPLASAKNPSESAARVLRSRLNHPLDSSRVCVDSNFA